MRTCYAACVCNAAQLDADTCYDDVVLDDWMRAKKQGKRKQGTLGVAYD